MGRQGNLKYIVFYLFLFLFLLDSFPLYSSVLHKKGAEGICGTPLFWNKENEVGTVKRLGKRDDVFKTPADLIEVPFYKVITNDTVDIYVEKEQWENGNLLIKIWVLYQTNIVYLVPLLIKIKMGKF